MRWRKEYGGLKVGQAKSLKDLEAENSRLKKTVANQVVDIDILRLQPMEISKPGQEA